MIERFDDFDPQSYRGSIEHEPYYETHYGGFEEQDSQDREHGHLVESHRSVTHVPQIKKAQKDHEKGRSYVPVFHHDEGFEVPYHEYVYS